MSLMAPSDQVRLANRFVQELSGSVDVRLCVHAGACEVCTAAEAILREITSLSSELVLSVDRGGSVLPEIRLEGGARGDVRFFGVPSGYELPAFIDSIVDVSIARTALGEQARARVTAIERRVHIQVFTTPT